MRPNVASVEVDARVAPVEVVQQVERLETKLHVLRAAERNELRHRQVDRPEGRPLDAVPHLIPERAERRLRERGPVQVAVQRLGSVDVVADLVDPLFLEALSVQRAIRARGHGQPAARPRRDDAETPASATRARSRRRCPTSGVSIAQADDSRRACDPSRNGRDRLPDAPDRRDPAPAAGSRHVVWSPKQRDQV